eukprot:SRR837773.60.p1 GENE.SRR837773.60~~SRR837773.60.p1  ORF type:complete len:181 (-),score=70.84 SRR837773.60:91-573(-)
MDLEVTVPRICVFRDAIVDLLALELGPQFSNAANDGLRTVLNYVGGAYAYVRQNYASRLKILASSWATANDRKLVDEELGLEVEDEAHDGESGVMSGDLMDEPKDEAKAQVKKGATSRFGFKASSGDKNGISTSFTREKRKKQNTSVPTTYPDMSGSTPP